MYYNYHGMIKKKINNDELVCVEFLDSYHKINNVMLLTFKDGSKYPIREYRFLEYSLILKKWQENKKSIYTRRVKMEKERFYYCKHCGNIIGMINDSRVNVVCCGEVMSALVGNSTEASLEKHIPVVKVNGNNVEVEVGSVIHPMIDVHHISWVYLQTEHGGQRKNLEIGKNPIVKFTLDNDKPLKVFAYCNLHGLWVKEL